MSWTFESMSFVSISSSYSWDLCLVVSLPVPDCFSSSVPTGFILAVLSLLLSFLQSIASMLSYSWVRALETKHFNRCGIKAELIYFALNVLLTFHLFVYYSKWTQTTDLCLLEDHFDTVYWNKLETLEMPLLTCGLKLKWNYQRIG